MMIKNLSKNTCKKYPDFHIREDLNFEDDGNHFRGFDYKGLPITTLRSENLTYCSIRIDYLRDNEFTWQEWHEAGGNAIADEFNCCDEIDLDKLIVNCEKCFQLINELNEKARTEELDMSRVVNRLLDEYQMLHNFIEKVKKNLHWWNLDKYDIDIASRYTKSLINTEDKIRTLLFSTKVEELSRKEKKHMIENLENYGYVEFRLTNFYVEQLEKMMNEYK